MRALQELNLYRRLTLFEVPLEPRRPQLEPEGRIAVCLLEGTEADLQAYSRLRPDVAAEEVRTRLDAGHRCFVASLDGRIASAVWIATGHVRIDYLDCDLELAAGDAYAYDAFTLPELRGQDLASWRSELMRRHVRANGGQRLIGAQLAENQSQARRVARRGLVRLGVVGWVGVGPWRHRFVRPRRGVPYLGRLRRGPQR